MNDDRSNWVALSPDPWNEIIPGLWQGGMYYGLHMTPCAPEDQFDVVVSMAGRGGVLTRITNPAVTVHSYYIDDDRLGPDEMILVTQAVADTFTHLRSGATVLVRCQMGWNRSGLVVGMVLRLLGYEAQDAIDLIRARRDPNALCNEHFVKYIYAHPGPVLQ